MALRLLCMDCDYEKHLTSDQKNIKTCPECGSINIQVYDDELGKGTHCAGTINPESHK